MAKTRDFDDTQYDREKVMKSDFDELRILFEAESAYPPTA
jgi:hypothetical protein